MSAWPYKVIDLEGTRHLEATLNKLVADGYDIETIHITSQNVGTPVHALIVARDTLPRAARGPRPLSCRAASGVEELGEARADRPVRRPGDADVSAESVEAHAPSVALIHA